MWSTRLFDELHLLNDFITEHRKSLVIATLIKIMLFQVQVIATNQFGSSDPSEVFRFHTSTVGEILLLF